MNEPTDINMVDRKKNTNKNYKTNDICKIFDISKSTLYRWERDGVISNVSRDWRNWRIYSDGNYREIKKLISKKRYSFDPEI